MTHYHYLIITFTVYAAIAIIIVIIDIGHWLLRHYVIITTRYFDCHYLRFAGDYDAITPLILFTLFIASYYYHWYCH